MHNCKTCTTTYCVSISSNMFTKSKWHTEIAYVDCLILVHGISALLIRIANCIMVLIIDVAGMQKQWQVFHGSWHHTSCINVWSKTQGCIFQRWAQRCEFCRTFSHCTMWTSITREWTWYLVWSGRQWLPFAVNLCKWSTFPLPWFTRHTVPTWSQHSLLLKSL